MPYDLCRPALNRDIASKEKNLLKDVGDGIYEKIEREEKEQYADPLSLRQRHTGKKEEREGGLHQRAEGLHQSGIGQKEAYRQKDSRRQGGKERGDEIDLHSVGRDDGCRNEEEGEKQEGHYRQRHQSILLMESMISISFLGRGEINSFPAR